MKEVKVMDKTEVLEEARRISEKFLNDNSHIKLCKENFSLHNLHEQKDIDL